MNIEGSYDAKLKIDDVTNMKIIFPKKFVNKELTCSLNYIY
jgi:hypothetical protein